MAATITINPIASVNIGQPISVSGTWSNPPALTYKDDTGSFLGLPSGDSETVVAQPFSYTHPPIFTAGTHTIVVEIAGVGGPTASTTVVVVDPSSQKTILVSISPAPPTAGNSMNLVIGLQNYGSTVPTLVYALDGLGAIPITGLTSTGGTMAITTPSAALHTIVVTDTGSNPNVMGSVTFIPLGAAPTATIAVNPLANVNLNTAFTVTGTYTNPVVIRYQDDGAAFLDLPPGASETIVPEPWSFTHPGFSTVGTHAVDIEIGGTGGPIAIANVTVVNPVLAKTLAVTVGPIPIVSGATMNIIVTASNYMTAPSLTYSLDGTTPVAMTGITALGGSVSITAPSAVVHTIVVHDTAGGVTDASVTFTPAASTAPVIITPTNGVTITIPSSATISPGQVLSMNAVASGSILVGGVALTGSAGSAEATVIGGIIYGLDASVGGHWFTWDGTEFNDTNSTTLPSSGAVTPTYTVSPNTPSPAVVGGTMAFSGSLSGSYVSAPSLTASVDGGTPFVVTGVTTTGWNMLIPVPAAGTLHKIVVTDAAHNVTGTTAAFTTTNAGGVSADQTTVTAGSAATIIDASNNTWGINSAGQVVINGTPDTTTSNVIELAYVSGSVWQENTGNLWWAKTSPTDSWNPPTGTSTSPLASAGGGGTTGGGTGGSTGGNGRVVAPLATAPAKGTWLTNQQITQAGMPTNGKMQYNVLPPPNFDPTVTYPVLFYIPENDEGGIPYPQDGGNLVNQTEIDGSFNTPAFRQAHPCWVFVCQVDQSIDPSGSNGNSNGGGYGDAPNSGANEQAITKLALQIQANTSTYSADVTRFYFTGSSLGAIAALASLVDNNTVNGVNKIWCAAMGFSEQLYRPATPNNSTLFDRMKTVPYIAVSTPNDNAPDSYDGPAWNYYTNNAAYPTKATFASGNVGSIKAGTSNFYYIRLGGGDANPWDLYRQMNADGGQGTPLYALLFSFIANVANTGGGTGGSGTGTGGSTNPPPSSGGLVLANGTIKDGTGATVVFRGVNVYQDQIASIVTNAQGGSIIQQLPHMNAIRLVCFGNNSHTFNTALPADIAPYVTILTNLGIYVGIDGHSFPQVGSVCTGNTLTLEANWYKAHAAYFINNKFVFFFSNNEPVQGDGSGTEEQVTAEHVAIYNAIRGTGSNAAIFMDTIAGGDMFALGANNPVGLTPTSAYATMTNTGFDLHYYAGDVVDPALTSNFTQSLALTQQIHTAGGVPAVVIGEYGPSQSAITRDTAAARLLDVVQNGSPSGCFAWSWTTNPDGSNPDGMLDGNGNLNTAFGIPVATWQAAQAAATSSGTGTGGGTTGGTTTAKDTNAIKLFTGTGTGSVGLSSIRGGVVSSPAIAANMGNFPFGASITVNSLKSAISTEAVPGAGYVGSNLVTSGTGIGPSLADYLAAHNSHVQFDWETMRDGRAAWNKTAQTGIMRYGNTYSLAGEIHPDDPTLNTAGLFNSCWSSPAGQPLKHTGIAYNSGNATMAAWAAAHPAPIGGSSPLIIGGFIKSSQSYVAWARSGKILIQCVSTTPTNNDLWVAPIWAYTANLGDTSAAEFDLNEQFTGGAGGRVDMTAHFRIASTNAHGSLPTVTQAQGGAVQWGAPHQYAALIDFSADNGTAIVTQWVDGVCVGITNLSTVMWGPGFDLHWDLYYDMACSSLSNATLLGTSASTMTTYAWTVAEIDSEVVGTATGLNARATAYISVVQGLGVTLSTAQQNALHQFGNSLDNYHYTTNDRAGRARLPVCMYLMFGPGQAMGYVDFFNPSTNRLVPGGTGLTWTQATGFKGNGTGYMTCPINLRTALDSTNINVMAYINGQADSLAHSGIVREFLNTSTATDFKFAWFPINGSFLGIQYQMGWGTTGGASFPTAGNSDGDMTPGWQHISSYTPGPDKSYSEIFFKSGLVFNTFGPTKAANFTGTGIPSANAFIASGNEGLRFLSFGPRLSPYEGDWFRDTLLAPLMAAFQNPPAPRAVNVTASYIASNPTGLDIRWNGTETSTDIPMTYTIYSGPTASGPWTQKSGPVAAFVAAVRVPPIPSGYSIPIGP